MALDAVDPDIGLHKVQHRDLICHQKFVLGFALQSDSKAYQATSRAKLETANTNVSR